VPPSAPPRGTCQTNNNRKGELPNFLRKGKEKQIRPDNVIKRLLPNLNPLIKTTEEERVRTIEVLIRRHLPFAEHGSLSNESLQIGVKQLSLSFVLALADRREVGVHCDLYNPAERHEVDAAVLSAMYSIHTQTHHCIFLALLKPEQYPNPMHEGVGLARAQIQSSYQLCHLHCTKIEE
jgi:hypothetical protein